MICDKNPKVLIAGLGNVLLRDDGVGVHAIRALRGMHLPRTQRIEVGTAVEEALPLMRSSARLMAIDVMRGGAPPGTIYTVHLNGHAAQVDPLPMSPHQRLLTQALAEIEPALRPELYVLGVEPGIVDFGMELSPAVKAALPHVLRAAQFIAAQWLEQKPLPQPFRQPPMQSMQM